MLYCVGVHTNGLLPFFSPIFYACSIEAALAVAVAIHMHTIKRVSSFFSLTAKDCDGGVAVVVPRMRTRVYVHVYVMCAE